MSAVAELKHDIAALEREHDALARAVQHKQEEFDQLDADIRRANGELEKIRAEIKRIKLHFGVQP